MFEVTVTAHIAAAHHLRGYAGECEKVHGHNYKIEATVETEKLDDTGLAMDFKDLKEKLRQVIKKFDHEDLNHCEPFGPINPSSENLAMVLYQDLKRSLEGNPVRLVSLRVWETPEAYVTYVEK